MSNLELLDRAAGAATCQVLQASGQALVGVGAVGIVGGGVGFVPFSAGALSLLAANYLCPDMPMGEADNPGDNIDGCALMAPGGYGQFQYKLTGQDWRSSTKYPEHSRATRIGAISFFRRSDGSYSSNVEVWADGEMARWQSGDDDRTEEEARATQFRILPIEGDCAGTGDDLYPPIPPAAREIYNYTDESTNCSYTVQLEGFAQPTPGGPVRPVYLIAGANNSGEEPQGRTDGGRMGGCNFAPTIYMPGPGDDGGGDGGGDDKGPYFIPVPDDGPPPVPTDGIPWWAEGLLAGATSAVVNQILEGLGGLLTLPIEESSFTLTAPCDFSESGDPLFRTWNFPEQSIQARMYTHQIAMMDMLQTHLNWKTPTCDPCNEKPTLEGDWRTISFRSDETSPYGKSRLRKRFRYRSTEGFGLSEVVDHWADFIFEAGPVCVIHSESSWGTPQVWASTADEGKRVIRHAGREAGIDPDKVGRWTVSSSDSARVGLSGTMRVDTTGGFYWITARDGSNSRARVAKT